MAAVEESLKAFARWLIPPEELLNVECTTAERIFNVLKRSKELNVVRTAIVGSIGKGTAIRLSYDIDCLVLLDPKPRSAENSDQEQPEETSKKCDDTKQNNRKQNNKAEKQVQEKRCFLNLYQAKNQIERTLLQSREFRVGYYELFEFALRIDIDGFSFHIVPASLCQRTQKNIMHAPWKLLGNSVKPICVAVFFPHKWPRDK